MASRLEDARRFSDRAEELRAKADGFGPENRRMLLQMAEYYDNIARDIEVRMWEREHGAAAGNLN